jgi:hypothetical protein
MERTERGHRAPFHRAPLHCAPLAASVEAAFDGTCPGRLFTLVGEPGLGKSRLAACLLQTLNGLGLHVTIHMVGGNPGVDSEAASRPGNTAPAGRHVGCPGCVCAAAAAPTGSN